MVHNGMARTVNILKTIILLSYLWSQTISAQLFNPDAPTADDINPQDVIHWQLVQFLVDPNGRVEAGLTLVTEQDFTIYEDKLQITAPPGYILISQKTPPTTDQYDPISAKEVKVYTAGEFFFYFEPRDKSASLPEKLSMELRYTGCTQVICLFPFTERFQGQIYTTDTPFTISNTQRNDGPQITSAKNQTPLDLGEGIATHIRERTLSFPILIIIIFAAGILTNRTPCVYPMIPITLRLLGRQRDKTFLNASMYDLVILVTYTSLGIFAASTGSMFGAFLQNKMVNIFFAVIMLILGLTMLGYGDFSALQSIGDRLGAGKPNLKNMFLMGVGAGFVASPCTGPVMGTLLTLTLDDGDIANGVIYLFTYSAGFALPYVFLGSAASKVSKINLSPHWQLVTKLFFASVMFCLFIYYLRIPFYGYFKDLKPHLLNIAIFSGITGLTFLAFYLTLGSVRHQRWFSVVTSLVLGTSIFFATQHLTSSHKSNSQLNWLSEESQAYELALSENKPIFIDGWAEWCEACKKMASTTFKEPVLVDELENHWILLKLDLTEDNETNDALIAKYKMPGLPTMVLVPADGNLEKKHRIVGEKSAEFLLKKLQQYRKSL